MIETLEIGNEDRRRALIEAAGELLAKSKNPKLVGTREIVALAGASKSAIDYYFGNKAKLIKAVYDEIISAYNKTVIADFYEANSAMLSARNGQREFVNNLLDTYDSFFKNRSQSWREILSHVLIRTNSPITVKKTFELFKRDMNAWFEIFKTITGKSDINESYFYYETTLMPIASHFYSSYKIKDIRPVVGLSDNYDDRYLDMAKKRLLISWGLNNAQA